MRQLFVIALNTFREAVRNRIFASLIVFSIAMMLLTVAVSSASLNEEIRIIKDIGLFLTSTFSALICVFVGVNLVYKEIERKTVYTILPKPIQRWQFLFGKYAGTAATMSVQVAVMGGVLWGLFLSMGEAFGVVMLQALWLIYVEILVVGAIALFFSSFSTPFLSGMLTLGIFIVGRFSETLSSISLKPQSPADDPEALARLSALIRGVASVLPDLSKFNVTPNVVYGHALQADVVLWATLEGGTYALLLLVLASWLLSRRDFI
jgi:ABC-type transport system involved in multi-copper enzyme maturation permease subunit